MKKSRKEFINKAHENACDAWKTKIEEEFPKLFKKEEKANGWYKDTICDKWCMFFENGIMKYGVDTLGRWSEDLNISYTLIDNDYKATKKEVGKPLIKEAKKKGFKKGVSFNVTNDLYNVSYGGVEGINTISKLNFEYISYNNSLNVVCNGGKMCIFKDGVWATIVESITRKQAEKELGKVITD
jgi:hypothetical protein